MVEILKMGKEELLGLWPEDVDDRLTVDEILHIFKVLGGDYKAAKQEGPGLHAELTSEQHGDSSLYSKAALRYYNICRIMARQLIFEWYTLKEPKPDWVAGIPDGATELSKHVARAMGVKIAEMVKEDKQIKMLTRFNPKETLLLVENFCILGTGFKEAVQDIISKNPQVVILPYELALINCGGLKEINVDGAGTFKVVTVAEYQN